MVNISFIRFTYIISLLKLCQQGQKPGDDMPALGSYFHLDPLAMMMMTLILWVSGTIIAFATRYLQGDPYQRKFYPTVMILTLSLLMMVSSDSIGLFVGSLATANFFLTRLMVYSPEWRNARYSGYLASLYLGSGVVALFAGFMLLSQASSQNSIQAILASPMQGWTTTIALSLILLGVMLQSALWPFHKWLTSSLNAPTPVSALMHAGLINAGGFILARFAPLFLEQPLLLNAICLFGMISALIGTLWKLIQPDIKRMLACSTLAQIGFMIAQCGLGLFPAAMAHLCWHGLFKAYLFLSSGSAVFEQRILSSKNANKAEITSALICGLVTAATFAWASQKLPIATNTEMVLIMIAMIVGAQLSLTYIQEQGLIQLPLALFITGTLGALYGISVYSVEIFLSPMKLMQPKPLNSLHVFFMAVLVIGWVAMKIMPTQKQKLSRSSFLDAIYVANLNASLPHPKTITAHRAHYQYKRG